MVNNKDFSKYQTIIDRFRGKVADKDFDAKFAAVTAKLPKTEKFLLKMELKRLASPCTRLVDLRGHVNGECKAYEHQGRVHFLDDVAIKVYEDNLEQYGGYTFGVYDAVMNTENNFRVIYQKEKAQILTEKTQPDAAKVVEKTQYPAKFFSTRVYHNRREERMNFAVPVLVTLNERQSYEAVSSDISGHGCKLRFGQPQPLHLDQIVTLRLTGMEQEFQFGNKNSFNYRVCNISMVDGIQLVGFERCDIEDKDSFLQFLTGFIQGNKRRYKLNMDNTVAAILARSFEQYAVPKINELPVFLEQNGDGLKPRYALTCANNQAVFQYWQNERGQPTLAFLLNPERIARVKKAAALGRNLIVYSFTHASHGKIYFYSADDEQLRKDSKFYRQFVAFAAARESFRVLSLRFYDVFAERAYSPFTLSNAITVKDEYLNLPLSDEVQSLLQKLPGFVTVSDITSATIRQDYASLNAEDIHTSQIRAFGHRYQDETVLIDEVGVNYRNQRQEARFMYNTPVHIECQGVETVGTSEDFSISGLRVRLEQATDLQAGSVVFLSFPKLQQITSSFALKQLPYEVVRINNSHTVINLKVYVEKHQHVGRSFFKLLIEKNRHKLKSDEYALLIPGLSKALRNVYSRSMTIPSLIVQSSGSRYKTEVIVASEQISSLFAEMEKLSDRADHFNLYPLLSHLSKSRVNDSQLKKMLPRDQPVCSELYIAINSSKELVDNIVNVRLASELDSPELKKLFIKKALKNGRFFCVRLTMSRTEPPDMGHLNPELSYIGTYAIHRAKQLEQEIWSVCGVIQCLDITDETMIRYQLL